MIHFDLPKEQSSIIKVIGVGGGGSNAVNHMFSQNIEGVNFIICNTDAQAIAQSKVPNKIQLGPHLTQGLGAGANPEIGRQATEESLEEIKRILEVNTKMAFITAGMGGGTGTGGAPILAKVCKDLGILTVGIVTTPFGYEGKRRFSQAEDGIDELKKNVDTLLVISNDKLRHQFGNLKMKEAFAKADNVLATAAKCITDVINSTGQINVDFADVCTVMRNGGVAILGSATATGENRAFEAIENALNSPLLNDNDIRGARWILININSAEGEHEFTMDEVDVIQNYLLSQAGEDTDVILGMGYDNTLGDSIGVTLIATGFEHKDPFQKKEDENTKTGEEKIVVELKVESDEPVKKESTPAVQLEIPVEDTMPTLFPPEEKSTKEEKIILQMEMPENPAPAPIVEIPSTNTVDKKEAVEVHFEITSPAEKTEAPVNQPQAQANPEPTQKTENTVAPSAEQTKEASNKSALSSEGFLVRPSQIYAEDKPSEQSNPKEESQPPHESLQDDEPVFELQLVVKNSQTAAEEEPIEQVQPIMMSPVEEPAMQDEAEELRRRAKERIAKLRNLSFNVNSSDPNNEFETVPAYLRRNMEMHNQIADVETFYSNYTVKNNDDNQPVISGLNTFLDGNKPD
ncbi:MAG TPA: cell division protein FtsZ [Ferruginibacter sp.]|nr:cell division protein FtsZ [Ferruginibacter sp.]HRO05105.1 cell division protein FtsZ [Ferruginibacter sp.]HRO95590.1 cell division protein FtsZ [Ferruginibacter sp.]HRP49551.1 cell division protein FtsZ [Ferruginibacter sp.]